MNVGIDNYGYKSRVLNGMVMNYFIEVTDTQGVKRLINVGFITDIVGNKIYINCGASGEQPSINCEESYEDIRHMILGIKSKF